MSYKADVTSEAEVEAAVEGAVQELGGLRFVVSCAASAGPSAWSDARAAKLQPFETVIRVNLIGTFNVLRYGRRDVAAGDPDDGGERGAVVLTASIAAFDGQIGQTAYSASKGGVVGLTLPAARDLSRRSSASARSRRAAFDTPLLAGLPEATREELGAADPAPRDWATPPSSRRSPVTSPRTRC